MHTPIAIREAAGDPPPRRHLGSPWPLPPLRITSRVSIGEHDIRIHGYPSRGGFIILEDAGAPDFDYLNLGRLSQAEPQRSEDPAVEDDFCRRLLQLGARWFDSDARWLFVRNYEANEIVPRPPRREVEEGRQPAPSEGESRWVVVGVVGDGEGFWVLDRERWMENPIRVEDEVPGEAARLTLAVTMEERFRVMQGLGAVFYKSLKEYKGKGYLNSWETREGPEHAGWPEPEGQSGQRP